MTAADVQLMQGMAQRVAATRLDLVNSEATFGELAWNWGKGHAGDGASWPRRLWFSGPDLVAWGWAFLPHRVRRSDGLVRDITGAYLVYQVGPEHSGLVDEVIDWYDGTAAAIERTVRPSAADEFALKRWAEHGYETDVSSLGDSGSWPSSTSGTLSTSNNHNCQTGSGSAPPTRPGRGRRAGSSGCLGSLDVHGRGLRRCPADGGVPR